MRLAFQQIAPMNSLQSLPVTSSATVSCCEPRSLLRQKTRVLTFGQAKPDGFVSKPILGPSGYFTDEKTFGQTFKTVLEPVIAQWQIENAKDRKPVVVTLDESNNSRKYFPLVKDYLQENGLDVLTLYSKSRRSNSCPLGMLAYLLKHFELMGQPTKSTLGGIMLTSGSRPETLSGLRVLSSEGGFFIPDKNSNPIQLKSLNPKLHGRQSELDLECLKSHYEKHVGQMVNKDRVAIESLAIFHDGRAGVSSAEFREQLFPTVKHFNSIDTLQNYLPPSQRGVFTNQAMTAISENMQKWPQARSLGLVNNADASLTRLIDEEGKPFTPSEVGVLLLYHLVENKKRFGAVIKTHDTSRIVDELASQYGLPVISTPVGFHQISKGVQESKEPVLIGFDGQGGIFLPGHPPMKDGLLSNFLLMELVAYSQKPLRQILNDLQEGLSRSYTHRHYRLQSKVGRELWDYIQSLVEEGGKIGELGINKKLSIAWQAWLKGAFTYQNEAKLFLENGTSVLFRQLRSKPSEIDVFIDSLAAEKVNPIKSPKKWQSELARVESFAADLEYKLSSKFHRGLVKLTPQFD